MFQIIEVCHVSQNREENPCKLKGFLKSESWKSYKNHNYVSRNEQGIKFLFLEEEKEEHWYEKKFCILVFASADFT